MYNLIVACDEKNGIGKCGKLPWNIPEDLKQFIQKTHDSVVVMGRTTWESIPESHKSLRNRINIVVSKTMESSNSIIVVKSFSKLEEQLNSFNKPVFIIGGESLYRHFLDSKKIARIYLTRIFSHFDCDSFFPHLGQQFYLVNNQPSHSTQDGLSYQFQIYQPSQSPYPYIKVYGENAYLETLSNILKYGERRTDRTGIGTQSLFGSQLHFNIGESFPLLTTKKMFLRGIVEELLWFLRGETDAQILADKKVHIWKGNSSRAFLDQLGFPERDEGDCGPIYGFNFRHYGANYQDCHSNYQGQGTDQLAYVIDLIQNNPNSRRILLNLWNPSQLNQVVLPPCHVLYQFNVSSDGTKLSCSMYQRSGDLGLGVPFNIASASLLTYILAKITGKQPDKLILTIGEAHIYQNHIEAIREQLQRPPRPFPQMVIENDDLTLENIKDLSYQDFKLTGYTPYPPIKMEMAV